MTNCSIVRDLLPLYADGLASAESAALIETHVKECPACRAELARMQAPLSEEAAAQSLDYKKALFREKRRTMKRTASFSIATLLLGTIICLLVLLSKGYFHIAAREAAPDGSMTATAYRGDMTGIFPKAGGFTLKTVCTSRDRGYYLTTYLGAEFGGMWWSPSGRYLAVSMRDAEGTRLVIDDYACNQTINVSLLFGVAEGAQYTFVQWREDDAMLIRYAYWDEAGAEHAGYFWYSCESWSVSGVVELPAGKTPAE